ADRGGLVIYPSAAAWKNTPDITVGANVRNDQVLLLMSDLDQMQVKVGIHESIIDRMEPGMIANVTLPEVSLQGKVTKVASVAQPAGWWTGNVVKYDTIVSLPPGHGLKPGMSAEVEIVMATHRDVLSIPVSAVMETDDGAFCWVIDDSGVSRRPIQVGDSNDIFIIVQAGLSEGERVALRPLDDQEESGEPRSDSGAGTKSDALSISVEATS
ncbi:MAG: efflux RND transporter periplasmic adaptor subunit, partial [Planctomycetota bacterium]